MLGRGHYLSTVAVMATLSLTFVCGKETEDVPIPSSYCDIFPVEVDAVHIYNIADELRRTCSVTLKADLERFMIGFNYIQLACGQYIKLYYDSNSRGRPDKVFDCRTRGSDYLFTPGRYLTVSFEKPLGRQNYNFSIIATSYEPGFFCESDQMYCQYEGREMCIDSDVRCDGVKNCPDAKDENLCSKPPCFGSCRFSHDASGIESVNRGGISTGILITIVLLTVLVIVGFITLIVCCCQRRRRRNQGVVIRSPPPTATQQSVQGATTAASPTGPVSPPRGTQLPPTGYQPVPAAPPSYQPMPASYPQGPASEAVPPPPAPYNPNYGGPPTQPPPYTTQAVASAPPMDQ